MSERIPLHQLYTYVQGCVRVAKGIGRRLAALRFPNACKQFGRGKSIRHVTSRDSFGVQPRIKVCLCPALLVVAQKENG
jgi:hypothetical protein